MLPLFELLFKEVTAGPTSGVLRDFKVVSITPDRTGFLLRKLWRTTSGVGCEYVNFALVPKACILRVERTLTLPGSISPLMEFTHDAWLLEESFDKLWRILERYPGCDELAVDVNELMSRGAI